MAQEMVVEGRTVRLIPVVHTRSMVTEGGKLLGMVATTAIFAQGWIAEVKRDGQWVRVAEKLDDQKAAVKALLAETAK